MQRQRQPGLVGKAEARRVGSKGERNVLGRGRTILLGLKEEALTLIGDRERGRGRDKEI